MSPADFYVLTAAPFKDMQDRLYLDPDLTYADVPALCGEFQPVAVEFQDAMANYTWPASVSSTAQELTGDVEAIAKLLDDCTGLPGDPYSLNDKTAQLDFYFARFDDQDSRLRKELGLPFAVTTTTAPWVTTAVQPPDDQLADSRPESILITLADLPAGWSEEAQESGGDQVELLAECGGPNGDVLFDVHDTWSSTPDFVSPDGSVLIAERVTLFGSTAEAEAMMASAWEAQLDTCYADYLRATVARRVNNPESPAESLPIGTSIEDLDVSLLALMPDSYDAASHLITMVLTDGSDRAQFNFVLTFVHRGRALAFVSYRSTSNQDWFGVIGPLIDMAASKMPSS